MINDQPDSIPEPLFIRRVGIILGLTLSTLLLLGLMGAAFDVLLLVLAATLIALPLHAGARWMSKRTNWPEGVSLAIVALLTIGVLIGMGWVISTSIGGQIDQLQEQAPKALKNAEEMLRQTSFGRQLLKEDIKPEKLLDSGSSRWLGRISGAISSTLGSLADLYVILFLAAFLAAQPTLYRDGLVRLVPKPSRKRAEAVLDKLGETLLGWLGGKLFSMVVVGVLSFVGLWLLDIQLAGALALFAGLITFIPNFGPIIALIPAVLLALLSGPQQALYVVLLYMGIQLVESNLLTPLIQNKVISMPPALVFISQLIIGIFAGGIGLALATPVMAIVLVMVKMLYVQDVLKDGSIKV
ncbi:AI-2E family transporter [Spirosoma spitsbergense]|uniref:AI-2E family transporter n=1 Tax=Spirosoma spitsbergense TaxID=431554 RepID=UPI0003671AB5|nr:AI-2E family transporter [Spirosoma spitsbergense]